MMLLKKQKTKTVFIGTTVFTLLVNISPDLVQAATYKGSLRILNVDGTNSYLSEFLLSTKVTPSNPGASTVIFDLAISQYKVVSAIGTKFPLRDKTNIITDLKATKFRNNKTQLAENLRTSFVNFNPFEGPFYEYGFSIGNYNTITGILGGSGPYPFNNESGEAVLRFYVPTDFSYAGEFGNFTIPASGTPDQDYKDKLIGFRRILNEANENGVLKFRVPTNVVVTNNMVQANNIPPRTILEFETTPIPESNPSAGLIVLGLIGGYMIVKQKSIKDQDS